MSYYHHSGEYQQDSDLPNEQTEPIPSWETLDPQPQQPLEPPSSNAFVSPTAPTPHALPTQQFDYSPLHTPIDYGEIPDLLFSTQAGMNFAPQERLVRSEGYPSPETEAFQHSPSPTTPTVPGPQRTRPRGAASHGTKGSGIQHQHHPYRRPQSALAGKAKEVAGARFSVVTGIQSYPASMSAPIQEAGLSHASSSAMLPPSTTRPQRPSLVSISSSSHQPMGPPPEPSHPSPLPPPTSMWPAPDTTPLSSSVTAPTVDFENTIRRVREVTKHFFTPRLDSFYDTSNHILKAYLELPGVRREHLFVTLATSAITRHRSVNVWGISLSPAWLSAGAAQAGDGTASTSQEPSSLGKTTHMSSGSLSSTSTASVPSMSAGEAAGTARASSAPSPDGGSGGAAGLRPPMVTSEMEMSLGLGLPPQYTLRERRYGEFLRLLPVPPETRARHVQAILEAGVLSLSISFGIPLTEGQVSSVREIITVG
ncbi:hypothetical protein DFJ43DRAFT_1226068 [Lentinula guzmanii]|uniref:Uncharacterized protein n=1 Tax=Lentinula guzmanii TaxID=2804957 RepID=A0AA38JF29_9AGAR|nr:hypothetical protein DFJ43DRAFT_1226068 [Lentinula guzmanii]